jgi:hypothetical protein
MDNMDQMPPPESGPTPEDDPDGAGAWDEQRWEKFLREGDKRSEEYMALLNMFGDEPNGHNIIARAMGWHHLVTFCGRPPSQESCKRCDNAARCPLYQNLEAADGFDPPEADPEWAGPEVPHLSCCEDEDEDDPWAQRREHPMIKEAGRLACAGYELFGGDPPAELVEPMRRLRGHLTAACGQLAAGLGDDDFQLEMIGLTIAYLKRAFNSMCLALGALSEVHQRSEASDDLAAFRDRLETLRGGTEKQIQRFRRLFRDGMG